MKEYEWIGDAIIDIKNLKKDYRYYQKYQEQLKKDYNNWPGPPESFSKEIWQEAISNEIIVTREDLKSLENKIKELRKIIKKLDREQNAKFNKV